MVLVACSMGAYFSLLSYKNDLCEPSFVLKFVEKVHCDIVTMDEGEHYFHTKEQLEFFEKWLKDKVNRLE